MSLIILRHQTMYWTSKCELKTTEQSWTDQISTSESLRRSSETCGPLTHCSHELANLWDSWAAGGRPALIIWAAPPQFWLAGSQMNHDGIALKEANNPSCGKCLNSPKMIISLSSGLPAALIQFRGADYLCRSWPKGNPIPEFSSWISMQISKTLSTIMLKLGSETGSICRGWNKLLLENGDAHANLKRVETNAKEEAQQGGRGLNGKAVPP